MASSVRTTLTLCSATAPAVVGFVMPETSRRQAVAGGTVEPKALVMLSVGLPPPSVETATSKLPSRPADGDSERAPTTPGVSV